jgi:hypothetical protein
MVGRRALGVTEAQAASATIALGLRVSEAIPDKFSKLPWGAAAARLNEARLAPAVKRSLLVLFGAVGLVLLIACVNVANLLLGRASARSREMAVRIAIGAGRSRLVQLLLTESLLLAFFGAVASLAVAWAGVKALSTVDPSTTLRAVRDNAVGAVAFTAISLDWSALAFALVVSLIVGVVGLAPALARRAIRDGRPRRSLRGGGCGAAAPVVAEGALALVLLAGSD